MTHRIRFAECELRIDQNAQYIETVFEDGTVAPARPNYEHSDVRRAWDLGYGGDCWLMTVDHECLHTLVGELRGFGHSVVLWHVAHADGRRWPEQGREEEGYVTSLQRLLRRGVVDALVYGLSEQAGLEPQRLRWLARGLVTEAHSKWQEVPE